MIQYLRRLMGYSAENRLLYSQAGQDLWVYGECFNRKKGGTFVDVGAHDGVSISNSVMLERVFGWTGVCVEANPSIFDSLRKNRTCLCVNACVDSVEHWVDFAQNGFCGQIVGTSSDLSPKEQSPSVARMKTTTLISILEKSGLPSVIDYLSVDVEGAEMGVLGAFPFDKYRFNVMSIERPGSELHKILKATGYVRVRFQPELDSFYVHGSFLPEYHENVISFWSSMRRRRLFGRSMIDR